MSKAKKKNYLLCSLKSKTYIYTKLEDNWSQLEWEWELAEGTKDEFIEAVARNKNEIFSNLSVNGNEVSYIKVWEKKSWYCDWVYKTLYFLAKEDDDGNIIPLDVDWVRQEVETFKRKNKKKWLKVGWQRCGVKYEYRKEPIPWTACGKGGRWSRPPRLYRTQRLNAIPEYKEFFKKKNDMNQWDLEKFRSCDRSWKRDKKCRHQWEKHLKNK